MPSAKVLEQKKQIVAGLVERLNNSCAGVIVDYKGINVTDDTALRKELREAGVEYTVVKKEQRQLLQVQMITSQQLAYFVSLLTNMKVSL